jgi:hypothetical protein
MFLESIISGKRNLFWVIFHILIGLGCTVNPFVLIIWFYLILLTSFNQSITQLKQGKPFVFAVLITYLVSFEILGRMAHAFPFIPTELSKYMLPIFSIIGIFNQKNRIKMDWLIMALALSISLFFDISNQRIFVDIINNFFGVIAVCFGLAFFSSMSLTKEAILKILQMILLAILPALIYTFIKTPDFEDITFLLKANFDTSGGAATNQVSTVFGLGVFLSFYFWINKFRFSNFRWFDILISLAFLAQGLLTFSRGGIIVAALGLVILVWDRFKNGKSKNGVIIIFGLLSILFIFNYIDNLTGGKLLLRYQGETEGTYNYGTEKDLVKITSGRSMILIEDLKLWFNHPILGVGVGTSKHIRGGSDIAIASHIELSRLLAEHGIIGLIYFIFLLKLGFKLHQNVKVEPWRILLFILFFIGISTTFHAAMRTFVTPLLISISAIGLYSSKNKNEKISIYRVG